jgi:hypothetical protein
MEPSESIELLRQLETRHEELLQRLEDLDRRVEKTLSDYQSLRKQPSMDVPLRKAS